MAEMLQPESDFPVGSLIQSMTWDVVLCVTGKQWIRQMVASAFLIPFLVCGMAFFINFIAIYYHASRAIPFGTMVKNHVFLLP